MIVITLIPQNHENSLALYFKKIFLIFLAMLPYVYVSAEVLSVFPNFFLVLEM
jgi:hypothetical protein